MMLKKIKAYFLIRIEEQTERQTYNLPFILFAFCVLFCQMLWAPGFFHDGHLYAALGRNSALFNNWLMPSLSELNYKYFTQHPPLYFIIEGLYYKIFPTTWTFARLFGVSWAFFILCLLLLIIKKHHSNFWAFLTGSMFVIIPPLIKKSRFPNLDLPLAFFIFLAIFVYFVGLKKYSSKIIFPIVGLIFGLALLTKGPPAIVLPFTIGLHLILTGNFKELKKVTPWLSLGLGVLIFIAWMVLVFKFKNISLYETYLRDQLFGTIVEGRGKGDFSIFTYPYFLLSQLGPIFLLSIFGLFQVFLIDRKNSLALLFVSLYLSVLIPFSLVKWKYSHYLMPIYPAIAALAAYPLSRLSFNFHKYYSYIYRSIFVLVSLALLCLPLTNTTHRDKELFQVFDLLEYLPKKPNAWMVVENSYPYHNVTNLVGWMNPYANVYDVKDLNISPIISLNDKNWIILINEERAQQIQHILNPRFKKLLHFKEWHLIVYLDKNLLPEKDSDIYFIQN